MQADAEHQQDHADFGELQRETGVGDEAGRVRADGDAGEKIADDRRQTEPLGEESESEGKHQGPHDGGDERGVMGHRRLRPDREA